MLTLPRQPALPPPADPHSIRAEAALFGETAVKQARAYGAGQVRIVGGLWRSRTIPVPSIAGLRPTSHRVRQTVFDWLTHLWGCRLPQAVSAGVAPVATEPAPGPISTRRPAHGPGASLAGMRVLDTFAGSGALGFEAASRGATEVLLLEKHPQAVATLHRSRASLDARSVEIHAVDAFHYLPSAGSRGKRFDLIFVDPPFGQHLHRAALQSVSACLAPAAMVYLESPSPWDTIAAHEACRAYHVIRQARAGMVHYYLLGHGHSLR